MFDFSKAYDMVHIPQLIQKMREKGIGGKVLDSLSSMYCNATSQVEVNGILGPKVPINAGVAQGDVLSPLLWNIYVDDLLATLRKEELGIEVSKALLTCQAFANDLKLVGRKTLRKYIAILNEWCQNNGVQVNPKKCGVLPIGFDEPYGPNDFYV